MPIPPHEMFELAMEIEEGAARLYRLLAGKFPPDGKVHETFSTLAKEEDQHAMRVGMLRSRYSMRPNAFAGFEFDEDRMRRLLEEEQTLQQLVSPEEFTLELGEALRFMIELERNFAGAHAHAMTASTNPELRSFFESLARQDRMHARILEEMRR